MSTIMAKTINDQTPTLSSTPCAEDVFDAIHRLMHLYRSEQYLSPNASGLTPMQGKVLRFFSNHPNSTLKELRVDFSKDKGQLAKLINGLKAMKLLKSQVDRIDKRQVRLELTPEGVRVQKRLRQHTQALAENACRGLLIKDRLALIASVNQLSKGLMTQAR
jgi:DNA-binding MarR family transcriptional regulator